MKQSRSGLGCFATIGVLPILGGIGAMMHQTPEASWRNHEEESQPTPESTPYPMPSALEQRFKELQQGKVEPDSLHTRTIEKGAIIADSQADLNRAVEISASGDTEALHEMISEGRVAFTSRTIQVVIVGSHPFQDYNPVEFRMKGSAQVYWTMGKYYHDN
jgi:hypothetical protein